MVSTEIRNVIFKIRKCHQYIWKTSSKLWKLITINDRLSGNKELTTDPILGKRFNQLIGKFDILVSNIVM